MRRLLLAAAVCPFALGGCVSMSRSEAVAPMAAHVALDARVDQVVLTKAEGLELTAGFDAGWRGRLIDRATYEE